MNCEQGGILEFLLYVGQAKRTFRSGWVLRGVEKVESVADHMYRMGIMSLLLPNQSDETKNRCMKLALVHDLAESVVGDLTEFDRIDTNEKHRRESDAMIHLTSLLPVDVGREIFSLFQEYNDQQTKEAKIVKDFDIFDMLLQAYEYEKIQDQHGFLEEFFSASVSKVKSDVVRQWLDQLMKFRSSDNQIELPTDSNLNTILKHILYNKQGEYLYKLPATDLRHKSDQLVSNPNPTTNSLINSSQSANNHIETIQQQDE